MPTTSQSIEAIEEAVHLACRAPSYHNSQPWRWVIAADGLQLFVDPDRLVATDTEGRQAVISCGAALDHFLVAAAAAGLQTHVQRCPNPENRNHLATVTFTPAAAVTSEQYRRAEAILRRRTDRLPLAAPPNGTAFDLPANDPNVVAVDVVDPADRAAVAEASQLTDALRLFDSAYHNEIAWWTSPFDVTDGIPHSSLVSAAEADRVDVGRNFPVTDRPERRQHITEDEAQLVVISTPGGTRADMLRSGETLSTLLLDATLAGLSTCTLSHITEVPASRDIIGALVKRPHPQVVVRIGMAPESDEVAPPTPRRPLSDVLSVST